MQFGTMQNILKDVMEKGAEKARKSARIHDGIGEGSDGVKYY